jgi:hypothetical protein
VGVRPKSEILLSPLVEGVSSSSRDAAPDNEIIVDNSVADAKDAEAEDDHEGDQQITLAKAMKGPVQPTQQMIEDHEVSHIPYRAWCAACVRGRGKCVPHKTTPKDEDTIPVISLDYGFFGTPEGSKEREIGSTKLPILIMKDRSSKAIWSNPVPAKGIEDPHALLTVIKNLDEAGYT